MARLNAPWTAEEVDHINRWQRKSYVHPFTCDQGHHLPLVATAEELTCPHPDCLYTQTWVHDFMTGVKR